MVQEAAQAARNRPVGRKRRFARRALLAGAIVLAGAGIYGWSEREQLADGLIADALADNDLVASYTIDSLDPGRQVLSDIVVGDPSAPDLTIERLEIRLRPRFGLPAVTEIRLVRPRLFATFRDGQASFGSLDRFIFTGGDAPFEFPDLRLAIVDGRALVESDYGRIGLKLAGSGHLRGGFAGELAAVAPQLALPGCAAQEATLFGTIGIDAERPDFSGPLRFDRLDCDAAGLSLEDGSIALDLRADRNLADLEGRAELRLGPSQAAGNRAEALAGSLRFAWRSSGRDAGLTTDYELTATDLATPAIRIASLDLTGQLRARQGFERIEAEGELSGGALQLAASGAAALASASGTTDGTLLEPLLGKLRRNLAAELPGSGLEASFVARRTGGNLSVVVPEVTLSGGSGATLLGVSRAQLSMTGDGPPRFEGNFVTGGDGLPRLSGRMEQPADGALEMRVQLPEYAAANARLAVPDLRLTQRRDGSLALAGEVRASGPLPGGSVQGLVLPVDGSVAANGALSLWNGCRTVDYEALRFANLALADETLTLCPPSARPILRYGAGGLDLAAGVSGLDLQGELGGTPLQFRSGAVGFALSDVSAGTLTARDLEVTLGPPENAARFKLADLAARLDPDGPGGTFAGADVLLAGVPLDILRGSGEWRYAGDGLELSGGSFVLEDREADDRFNPLVARDATLTLVDNLITADALLTHAPTQTEVSRVRIVHDLATAAGHADLIVDDLTFRQGGLQPLDLSALALGVVANVDGTVTGTGRIDWNEEAITSSGAFSSDSLDLAAAFGPVKGASGTVEFTDLLGMTTAPDQRLKVAAVNPGIEIYDGEVAFRLTDGQVLDVEGGTWPFLGGTLTLRPLTMNIGVQEVRAYEVEIAGLEAARFVERMELNNLSASGTFDGRIPIIFDEMGNGRLEGGVLVAREGGGHLSYVGQLTYEDLGTMANLAFSSLRDIRFDNAVIGMNGPLTGELVTNVRFDGIGQGETAARNIFTRQIAKLPIRLLINVRAPFYQLMSSTRALYDPSAVRDPRGLGLLTDDGTRLRLSVDQQTVDELDEQAAAEAEAEAERRLRQSLEDNTGTNDESPIQPPESEAAP